MIALTNARLLPISGPVIEKGNLLIENGKIKQLGKDVAIPSGVEVIDVRGYWVTPGFIDCHTHISTFYEPRMMPSLASDANECSTPITPQVRAMDALNPQDPAIAKVRAAGFTTVYTGPGSGNIIGGTGISLKLRGSTAEEMIIPGSDHMKMALGENPKRAFGTRQVMPITRMGTAALLRKALFDAKAYAAKKETFANDPTKFFELDFEKESLQRVVRGEQKVRIHCHRSDDILTAIRIAEEFNLDFSLEHCTEGYLVKEVLAEKHLYCIIGPLLMEPSKQEVWGMRLETAGELTDAGIKVCLTADTGSKTAWLPMEIGLLTRRGLSEEAALKGITQYPSELLGLQGRLGTLEVGKDADIAIFDGNPFCNLTLCRMTIIDGVIHYRKDL
jgi:imidazolonepropionase-like amidohydrolase